MKNIMERLLPLLLTLGIVLGSLVALAAFNSGGEEGVALGIRGSTLMKEGWLFQTGNSRLPVTEFPYEIRGKEGVFYNILPEEIHTYDILVFNNQYQYIAVSIDGESVYQYGLEADQRYFIPANIQCYVRLKPEYAGKKIEIRIRAGDDSDKCILTLPRISNRGEIVWDTLRNYSMQTVYCILVGAVGCIGLLLVILMRFRGLDYGVGIFGPLGFFMLTSAIWVFTDSRLAQLAFGNSQLVMLISFQAFMLFPIPLLRFMEAVSGKGKNYLRSLEALFALNCILQNMLYIFRISNFIQNLILTHILDVVSILYIVYLMVRETVQNKSSYAKGILAGICLFAGVASMSLVTFYQSNGCNNSNGFVLGSLLMNLVFLILSVRRYMQFSEENMKLKVYRELAYKDILTGIGNRTLYEALLPVGDEKLKSGVAVTVALLDINGLKAANDKYGHSEGDLLICRAAKCIKSTFGERGEYFRIGGDEFVVIVWGEILDPEKYRLILGAQMEEANRDKGMQLSISAGYVTFIPEGETGKTLKELVAEADEKMYIEKKAYHDMYGRERDGQQKGKV